MSCKCGRKHGKRFLERIVSELIVVREKSLGDTIDLEGPEYNTFRAGLWAIAKDFGYSIEEVYSMAEYLDGSVNPQ